MEKLRKSHEPFLFEWTLEILTPLLFCCVFGAAHPILTYFTLRLEQMGMGWVWRRGSTQIHCQIFLLFFFTLLCAFHSRACQRNHCRTTIIKTRLTRVLARTRCPRRSAARRRLPSSVTSCSCPRTPTPITAAQRTRSITRRRTRTQDTRASTRTSGRRWAIQPVYVEEARPVPASCRRSPTAGWMGLVSPLRMMYQSLPVVILRWNHSRECNRAVLCQAEQYECTVSRQERRLLTLECNNYGVYRRGKKVGSRRLKY